MLTPGFFKEGILRIDACAHNKYSQSERVWKLIE